MCFCVKNKEIKKEKFLELFFAANSPEKIAGDIDIPNHPNTHGIIYSLFENTDDPTTIITIKNIAEWRRIYEANKALIGSDPTQLKPRMVLTIPGVSAPQPSNNIVKRVLELTNIERSKAGLPPLRLNPQLTAAAQAHSENMARSRSISHQLPGELSLSDRISHAGYKWSEIAENVAAGQKTPEQAVSVWINEVPPNDAHRRNILNPNYRELGVGYSNNYWTQDFGSPAY